LKEQDVILKENELDDYLLWRPLNEKAGKWKSRVRKERKPRRSNLDRKTKFNFIANLKTQIGCFNCREDNYIALEIHHLNPGEKKFSFHQCYIFTWEEILDELKKCKVLCSNCHRKGELK